MSADCVLAVEADATARLRGRIDVGNAARVLAEGNGLIGSGRVQVINLSQLESADSVSLAVLLAWHATAGRHGVALSLVGMPERLRALAHLSDAEALLGLA